MPRTPQQAIAAAAQQASDGPRFEVGTCLMQVRECYDVAARYPDAATAWEHARQQVTRDPNEIPRGVPVWWTGGAKGHGHVAISLGKGMCWSTDIKRPGYFDRVPIADIGKRWG
ncbi:MAG: hypothetical protein HZY75_13425 [Nocardioidaceae bacterium]|nr:MAG: hypothetical protein HZY75_13425 [Nocardioidaceae bacterium]